MGVGKTTVGKTLAENLNYNFVDMDDNKHWVKRGFSKKEQYDVFWNDREKFHDIETDILKYFCMNNHENSVISTGGAIILREENINVMKSNGIVIFLNASAKTIRDRIKNSDDYKKSHIKGISVEDTKEFMISRESKYKITNLEVDTNNKSIEEVCYNIKLYLYLYNNVDIEVLKKNNVYLMGGSILRLFMNLPLNTDLDFYFVDDKSFKNVDDYFRKNFKFLHKTLLFINFEVNNLTVSLVYDKKLLGTYENLNKSYSDFTISAGCFDFGTETFKYPKSYFDDIKNKRLIANSDLDNQFPANLLKRIKKFKKMGFTIDDELVDEIKDRPIVTDKFNQRVIKKSWLRDEDVYPIVPNIDVFVNWLMDIKYHKYFDKFNVYLWGGFISWPEKTKDIDILITKRNGQHTTLKELEELMVDMFDLAYDIHGFFLDTCYMRIPQWIADYPRNREMLRLVERRGLWITITKYKPEYVVKFKRYGKLNCCYMGTWEKYWKDKNTEIGQYQSDMIYRWVDLDANYARMVNLRNIIKYYENNKERNIEDFKEKFQEYSGY
jgi:shikimate kinase